MSWRKSLYLITALAVAGMLVTAYLVYQHYKPAGGSFCNVNDVVNCDIVNKSKYSEILGFPVALLGFFTYAIFAAVSFFLCRYTDGEKTIRAARALLFLNLLAIVSLGFSLYLTIIEIFVLQAACVLCVTQQILILLISLTLFSLWFKMQKLWSRA